MSHGDDPGEVVPLEQVRTTLPPSEIVPADEVAYGPPEPGYTICLRCLGWGEITSPARCPACLGAREDWCEGISIPCKVCHGTGRVNVPCPACEGNGWVREERREAQQTAEPREQPAQAPSPVEDGAVAQDGEAADDYTRSGTDAGGSVAGPQAAGDSAETVRREGPDLGTAERNGKALL